MAKTYELYQKEWLLLKQELLNAVNELEEAVESRGQMDGVMERGAMEIGRRVRELRELGWQGDELADFLKDSAVRQMDATIKKSLAGIEKSVNQVKSDGLGPLAKLVQQYDTLNKGLAAEVKTRSKKLSTKLEIGNKSLPKLKALSEEVAEEIAVRNRVVSLSRTNPPKLSEYEKNLQGYLTKALNEAKGSAQSREKFERAERLLVDRNLRKNFGEAKRLFNAITEAAKAGQQAQASRNVVGLSTAKQAASQSLAALVQTVKPYVAAIKDTQLHDLVQQAKNKAAIEQAVEAMSAMLKEAKETEGELRARRLA